MQPEGTGGFREEGTSNRSLGQRRVCDDPGRGQGETLQGAQVSSTPRLGCGIEASPLCSGFILQQQSLLLQAPKSS